MINEQNVELHQKYIQLWFLSMLITVSGIFCGYLCVKDFMQSKVDGITACIAFIFCLLAYMSTNIAKERKRLYEEVKQQMQS